MALAHPSNWLYLQDYRKPVSESPNRRAVLTSQHPTWPLLLNGKLAQNLDWWFSTHTSVGRNCLLSQATVILGHSALILCKKLSQLGLLTVEKGTQEFSHSFP